MQFKNKVAFITGAASGIGFACAHRYAKEGAIVIGSDIQGCPTWAEVTALSPESVWLELDCTDEQALNETLLPVVETLGRIDIILTSAGMAGGGPAHMISLEDWDKTINLNLRGTLLPIRALLPRMIEQRSGNIITIASVEGLEGSEGGSAYNASKGAVVLLTKNMAMDYGRLGIRVNAICPGFIDTPMLRSVMAIDAMKDVVERIKDQHKLGRLGQPEEIAGAACFLASDDASFITGHALPVDGGYVAGHSYGIAEMMGLS